MSRRKSPLENEILVKRYEWSGEMEVERWGELLSKKVDVPGW